MDIAIPIINNATNTSLKGHPHHHHKLEDRHHRRLPCFRRTTNNISHKIQFLKPLLIFILFTAILLSVLIISAFGIGSLIIYHNNTKSTPSVLTLDQTMEMVNLVCNVTHYPSSCVQSLQHEIVAGPAADSPARHYVDGIFKLSLTVATRELHNMSGSSIPAVAAAVNRRRDERMKGALKDCRGLIEDAIDKIETSIVSIEEKEEEEYNNKKAGVFLVSEDKKMVSDVKTWVSAALTNTDTCLDGLEDVMDDNENSIIIPEEMKIGLMNAKEYVTNCLGIVSNFDAIHRLVRWQLHRR